MKQMEISFTDSYTLSQTNISATRGFTGLYFIFLEETRIMYPFDKLRLIYIGMSESVQNSIGNRLVSHKSGKSGNLAIMNYAKEHNARFTYLTWNFLKVLGHDSINDIESYFIIDFVRKYGSQPICNNQSNFDPTGNPLFDMHIDILWGFFS
ncbi:MAG: GIY-YIG nuclease family protein [bacterium]|nr:GIY-YIG nuclease family protein [bacterium]